LWLRYSELPKNEVKLLHSNEKEILTAAKVFMILGTIVICFITWGIGLMLCDTN
jgi:hypothetical protein